LNTIANIFSNSMMRLHIDKFNCIAKIWNCFLLLMDTTFHANLYYKIRNEKHSCQLFKTKKRTLVLEL